MVVMLVERDVSSHSDTRAKCTANVQKRTAKNCGVQLLPTMTRIKDMDIVRYQVWFFGSFYPRDLNDL